MYIFSKSTKENRNRLKGKSITQFSKHLESEGWPPEFENAEARDRIKVMEKNNRFSLKNEDYVKISKEMGLPTHRYDGDDDRQKIKEKAEKKGFITGNKFTRKERKKMFGLKK